MKQFFYYFLGSMFAILGYFLLFEMSDYIGNNVTHKNDINSFQQIASYCHIKDICESFKKESQNCSTAGNLDSCLQIKMGRTNHDTAKVYCDFDGSVNILNNNNFKKFDCFFNDLRILVGTVN